MNIENKVSVKYITKNIKTDDNEVFLVTRNQAVANTISKRNLRVIETRLCIAWLSASLDWPLKKIRSVRKAITEKRNDRIAISLNKIVRLITETTKYPVPSNRIFSNMSNKTYL
jgi:hypothetical protein